MARFSRLLELPGTADLGAELNAVMKGIADTSPELAGALPGDVLQELLRTVRAGPGRGQPSTDRAPCQASFLKRPTTTLPALSNWSM